MKIQDIPELIETVRETYPVSDVEIKFRAGIENFAVRIDVCINTGGKKVEYGTCWYHAEDHHTVKTLTDSLFYAIKSEMNLLD